MQRKTRKVLHEQCKLERAEKKLLGNPLGMMGKKGNYWTSNWREGKGKSGGTWSHKLSP